MTGDELYQAILHDQNNDVGLWSGVPNHIKALVRLAIQQTAKFIKEKEKENMYASSYGTCEGKTYSIGGLSERMTKDFFDQLVRETIFELGKGNYAVAIENMKMIDELLKEMNVTEEVEADAED